MLLPQSEAFHTLRRRLNCVPNLQVMPQERQAIYFLHLIVLYSQFQNIFRMLMFIIAAGPQIMPVANVLNL